MNWAETQLAPSGAAPKLVTAKAPADDVVAYWTTVEMPANDLVARLSRDEGLTWDPVIVVDDNTGDVDRPVAAYDPVYRDFHFAWLADDGGSNAPYAGGFRPHFLNPVGWSPGSTAIGFEFSAFDSAADQYALAFLSTTTQGPSFVLDGLEIGLPLSTFTVDSLTLLPVLAAIASDGSGSTPLYSVSPDSWTSFSGISVFGVGLGLEFTTFAKGSLTDVVPVWP